MSEQNQQVRQLKQEEIARVENILKAMDFPEPKKSAYKVEMDFYPKDDVIVGEDTVPWPAGIFDEPISTRLEQAIELKAELTAQLASIIREIESEQIILDRDMKDFGFYGVTGGDTYQVYRRKDAFSRGWEVLLNLTKPNKVKIGVLSISQDPKVREVYTYTIKDLDAFRTLLIQLEII